MNRPRPPSDNGIGDPTSGGVARFPRWADQETKLAFAIWLGREDSNLRMAESKSAALPLGYAPMRRKARTALAESGRTIVPGVPRRNGRAGRNLLRLHTAAGAPTIRNRHRPPS
jgi:hypothetical protein